MSSVENHHWGKNKPVYHKFEKRGVWNTSDFLPPNEILGAVIGSSGEGKTTILLQILTNIYPEKLKWVFVFTKIEGNEIYKSLEKHCVEHKINYVFESDIKTVNDIVLPELIKKLPKDEHALVILDDFNNGGRAERTEQYTTFNNEMFTKARNWRCNLLFVVQSYTSISTLTRQNLNFLVSFNIKEKHMIDALKKEIGMITHVIPKGLENSTIDNLIDIISEAKHSYFTASPDVMGIYIHGKSKEIRKIKISC